MAEQAPLSYITQYYSSVQRKNRAFPEIAAFWQSGFRHVDGRSVLNLGCGPMLYDNMLRFRLVPERYVGLDLNAASFEFLAASDDPDLVEARHKATEKCGDIEFLSGDVFDHAPALQGQFDVIVGVGFFATFEGENFDNLIKATREMLTPAGKLLKITWHGSQRTQQETADKLRYRYDNENEPPADELVRLIEAQGFRVIVNDTLDCPPDTIGWKQIQVALFGRADNTQPQGEAL